MNQRGQDRGFLVRDRIANLLRLGSLIIIAVGLFAMAGGGTSIYLNLDSTLALERADRAAEAQARQVADRLDDMQRTLREVSVVDAARSGSEDALREALRERGIVNILQARVLPGSIEGLADAGLDFEVTQFVIEAARNGRAETRVLQPGTPAESLALAERLPGDAGVLLLRLTVSVLLQEVRIDEALDFVALAQRVGDESTVLTATGRATVGTMRSEPVAGSSLVLQWNRAVIASPMDLRASVIIALTGLIVLLVGMLVRRRTRLARYLERPVEDTRAAPWSADAQPSRHRANDTLVMARQNPATTTRSKPSDDDPETVVADDPELPDWLFDETGDMGSDRT
jgi:hypothetical protein